MRRISEACGGGLEIDADALELDRDREQRRAGDEVDVALALDDARAREVGEQAGAPAAGDLVELGLADGARLIGRPRRLHLLLDAEPLGEVDLAAIDPLHQVADRVDPQAAILELGDQLEPLDVLLAVVGDAAADLGVHERAARLIEPDRAARDPRCRGELVDRQFARVVGAIGRRSCGQCPRRVGQARRKIVRSVVPSWRANEPVLYGIP